MYIDSSGHKIDSLVCRAMSAQASETAPRWTTGLHRMGLYYEGFVSDAPAVLEEYYKETVTSFGVRDSSRRLLEHCKENCKENECTDETTAQDGKKVQLYMYRCKEASSLS